MTDTTPFLITIPTRPGDPHIPEGWSTLQIGRETTPGDGRSTVGLVCHDPLQHELAIWLSECTIATEMAADGWLRAFSFGRTSVWYRPAKAVSASQQAA